MEHATATASIGGGALSAVCRQPVPFPCPFCLFLLLSSQTANGGQLSRRLRGHGPKAACTMNEAL
eukprot:scaffold2658_cov98-Isochrysis_galbana.AAC.3